MKRMITAVVLMAALSSCKKTYEYKVVHFDRDEAVIFEKMLNELGSEGWKMANTLSNNGINARYIAFEREK